MITVRIPKLSSLAHNGPKSSKQFVIFFFLSPRFVLLQVFTILLSSDIIVRTLQTLLIVRFDYTLTIF